MDFTVLQRALSPSDGGDLLSLGLRFCSEAVVGSLTYEGPSYMTPLSLCLVLWVKQSLSEGVLGFEAFGEDPSEFSDSQPQTQLQS